VDADLKMALSAMAQAAEIASQAPTDRIGAARGAAALAIMSDPPDWDRAANFLETAVLLLPEVAPRRLGRGDQQSAIGDLAGLGADAAALALISPSGTTPERAARALRLLEAGRAVLLSQVLETRSDLTDLSRRHPDLAARFASLRDQLDQASTTGPSSLEPPAETAAADPPTGRTKPGGSSRVSSPRP
jgi:hypothetical protein